MADRSVPKTDVLTVLERMRALRESQGNIGSAHGYRRGIRIVEQWPGEYITLGDLTKTTKGIGPSITEKIIEFINTGRVAELPDIEAVNIDPERDRVVAEFTTLHGVGPVTANRWYDQGYRDIDQIIPFLTQTQQIAQQYQSEITERIPRREIQTFERVLKTNLPDDLKDKFVIAGSYRRLLPSSGDVDMILLDDGNVTRLINEIAKITPFTVILGQGAKKILLIMQLISGGKHRRVDFEIVQPEEYIYAITYFTGSKQFNTIMRTRAAELGYRLNEKNMKTIDGKYKILVQSEPELFSVLGIKWLNPENR